MPRAGTAFIAFRGDFSTVNRQVSAYGKTLDRQLNRGTNAWQAATKKQTQTLQQLGRTARFAAGGVALLGGIAVAKSIGVAADFEQQVSRLGAVADASAKQLAMLKTQALAAGAATKFSALDAAAAQTELAKGGLSVQQIMGGGLKAALGLAAAGELELADASRIAVNAIKLFGLSGKDAESVADAFATAANKTTADVGDFGLALAQGGAAAKAAGFSFTETVAALEALAEVGVKGSDAGTSLKTSLAQLAKPTAKSAAAMKQLGIDFFDAQGNMKPLTDIAALLQDKLGGLTKEQRLQAVTTIAGTDGMRTLLSLYEAGPDKIGRFEKGLQKQGTAADVAAKKQDNLRGKLENFRGSIETLQISVGTQVLPVLSKLAERATKVANTISKISTRKDLDFGEKVHLSLKAIDREFGPDLHKLDIPGKLAAAISFAVPKIAEAAAKAVPKIVGAFVDAWIKSSVWGRLVIGGFLLQKLGGFAAFRALGAKTGGAYAAGFAATSAPALAATTAAGGVAGGVVGGGRRPVGAPGFRSGAPVSQLGPRRGLLGRAGAGIAGAAVGGLPGIALTVALVLGPDAIKNLKKGVGESLHGDKTDMDIKLDDLVDQAAFTKLDDAVKKGKLGISGLRAEMSKLSHEQLSIGSRGQLLRDAKSMDPILDGFRKLRSNALVSMTAIGRATDETAKAIRHTLGANTKAGREALEKNMRLSRHAIEDSLKRGWINGDQALKGLLRSFRVNSRGSKEVATRNFGQAKDAILGAISAARIGSDRGLKAINKLFLQYLAGFGLKGAAARFYIKEGPRGAGFIVGSDKSPMSGRKNARGGLVQFGAPGAAGRDTIPAQIGRQKVAVGSGEVAAVINRHQMPVLNARLADFGGLPGFFKKVNREHFAAKGGVVAERVAEFARGGTMKKIPRQVVSGPDSALKAGVQTGLDRVRDTANQKLARAAQRAETGPTAAGVGMFDGKQVAKWIIPYLVYGRKHGWTGSVSSGFRTFAEQTAIYNSGVRPAAVPGTSNHEGSKYPRGAVDVTEAAQLAAILAGKPGPHLLEYAGAKDPVHFSHPHGGSYARGGLVGYVGDSLGVGTAKYLKARLAGKMQYDVLGGRNSASGIGALGKYLGKKFERFVLDLGTNDLSAGALRASIKQADKKTGHRLVLASTVNGSKASAKNAALHGLAHGDVSLFEWAKRSKGLVGDDGIHGKDGAAYAKRAAMMAGALVLATRKHDKKGKGADTKGGAKAGSLTHQLRQTLKRAKTTSGPLKNALAPFLARLDKLGLPKKLLAKAKKAADDHARFAELATNAASLNVEHDDGSTTRGVLKGSTDIGWLAKDLTAQMRLRNRLVEIRDVIVKRRGQIARALKLAEKQSKKLGGIVGKGKPEKGTPGKADPKNPSQFAGALLSRLGIPVTSSAVDDVVSWAAFEGGHWNNAAHFNPLNTTQSMPGATSMNGVGVKAYKSWDQGLEATVKTLRYGAYSGVLKALRGGTWDEFRTALANSPWVGSDDSPGDYSFRSGSLHNAQIGAGGGGKSKGKPAPDSDRQRRVLKALVPKLKTQSKGLTDALRGDLGFGAGSRLEELQGLSGPHGKVGSPWPIGKIPGGSIFQTQLDLQAAGAKPAVSALEPSEKDTETADLLRQLLREANLRTAVAERQFDVFRNFPPFGGQFAQGGVVPGPEGAARMVVAHGGETITPPGQSLDGLQVLVYGDIVSNRRDPVEVVLGDRRFKAAVKNVRAGGRPMPGRTGGGL